MNNAVCGQPASSGDALFNDIMWQALGEALALYFGEIDALQDSFDTWGAQLKRATCAR